MRPPQEARIFLTGLLTVLLIFGAGRTAAAETKRLAGRSGDTYDLSAVTGPWDDTFITDDQPVADVEALIEATSKKGGRDDTLAEFADGGGTLQIRKDALREAALSYGARGGLAWRSRHIMSELQGKEDTLNRVFNFQSLLVKAPSGLLIEPPIITRADEAMLITDRGREAAVADRVFNISKEAKIVPAARRWEDYLVLDYETDGVDPPPKILWPESVAERRDWEVWIKAGWEQGVRQADEIFQQNLQRLVRDFNGMVRYRMLLAQGMVSEPFALHEDRGVTGDGMEMRVGDRAIRITGPSQFHVGAEQWQPADR